MLDGNDRAVVALSKFLDKLVLRADDERRVESGESVPLHDLRVRTCGFSSRKYNQAIIAHRGQGG